PDLIGACSERTQDIEREARVALKRFGIGCVNAVEGRPREPVASRLPLGPRRLQPFAHRHQLVDLGDDAVLFGERRKCDRNTIHSIFRKSSPPSASLLSEDEPLKVRRQNHLMQEGGQASQHRPNYRHMLTYIRFAEIERNTSTSSYRTS